MRMRYRSIFFCYSITIYLNNNFNQDRIKKNLKKLKLLNSEFNNLYPTFRHNYTGYYTNF